MDSSTKFSDLLSSYVRTVVPLVVGWLITFGATHGVHLGTGAETLLTTAVTGAYYIVVRAAEHYLSPSFGWLLGLAKPPSYPASTPVASEGTLP